MWSWPKIGGDALDSSHSTHVQLNSSSDNAESLKLIAFVVFLLVIENKMDMFHRSDGSHPGIWI